jgi:DnaK suppressor protein
MPMHVELHDQLVAHGHALASRLGRLESECAHHDSLRKSGLGVRAASPALANLISETRENLASIEATLHRMALGRFEICARCGAGIAEDRLAAAPHLDTCDSCSARARTGLLAEVSAQHTGVRRLLESIVELVDRVASDEPASLYPTGRTGAVLALLGDLEYELTLHFATEERGGYIAEAVAIAPRLARDAAALQAEHPGLQRAASELTETARQAGRSHAHWRELRDPLMAFARELLDHEGRENELISHAWTEDEGGDG